MLNSWVLSNDCHFSFIQCGSTSICRISQLVKYHFLKVVRAVCCIGVAHNYFSKRKYNLVELVRPEQEPGAVKMETPDEIKTNKEGCEINSETSDGVKVESSDVKTENSDNKEVERDSTEVNDSKGKMNVNGNSEVYMAKGTKDVEAC